MDKRSGICETIDSLTLEILNLMEQRIRCVVSIEKQMDEGKVLLAKARYVSGSNVVSSIKLPTESDSGFNALYKVTEENGDLQEKHLVSQKFAIDKEKKYLDPLKWFGVLVPRCLQVCKEKSQKTLDLIVEHANIQNKLSIMMYYLYRVRDIKNSL